MTMSLGNAYPPLQRAIDTASVGSLDIPFKRALDMTNREMDGWKPEKKQALLIPLKVIAAIGYGHRRPRGKRIQRVLGEILSLGATCGNCGLHPGRMICRVFLSDR